MTGSSAKARVLVIDDEVLVVEMLARLLRRRYDVTTATSGREGLRLACQGPWDAILCDVMLPDLGGLAVLEQLQQERPQVLPQLGFMSGGAFGDDGRELIGRLGPDGWLAKPFGRAQLEAFIGRLVEQSNRTAAPG